MPGNLLSSIRQFEPPSSQSLTRLNHWSASPKVA